MDLDDEELEATRILNGVAKPKTKNTNIIDERQNEIVQQNRKECK